MENTEVKKPFHWTYLLAGINIAVFVVMMLVDSTNGLITQVQFGAKVNYLIVDGQYFRLLTAMFLHGNLMHILFNMMALLNLGVSIEYIFGKTRFLAIYFISGLVASMGSFLFNDHVSVGASGAIFGLLGAFLFFSLLNRDEAGKLYRKDTLTIIGINLVYGFMVPSIDNSAHIFGLIGGFLACWALLNLEFIPWAKYVRILSITILTLFTLYTVTIGFNQYKGSESYYYNKSVISFSSGDNQTGLEALRTGYEKYPTGQMKDLVEKLKAAGVLK